MTNPHTPTHQDPVLVRTPPCFVCGKPGTILVDSLGFTAWQAGTFAQVAFPSLSAGERELLISGTHPTCWDEMFPEEDE